MSTRDHRADTTAAFNRLVGGLDYPMFVVTTAADGQRAGCLVGFVTQTSIVPPRILVCLSKVNHTTQVARRALWLAVHVLREGDLALARLFGELTEERDPVDKFDLCHWSAGPGGVPVLRGLDCVVGRIVLRIAYVGDHVGHLLAVDGPLTIIESTHGDRRQLGYQDVRQLQPGNPATG